MLMPWVRVLSRCRIVGFLPVLATAIDCRHSVATISAPGVEQLTQDCLLLLAYLRKASMLAMRIHLALTEGNRHIPKNLRLHTRPPEFDLGDHQPTRPISSSWTN